MPNPERAAIPLLLLLLFTHALTTTTPVPAYTSPTARLTSRKPNRSPIRRANRPTPPRTPPQPAAHNAKARKHFYKSYAALRALEERWSALSHNSTAVSLQTVGTSFENRSLSLLRVGRTSAQTPKRVLLTGLQHAREWIVPPVLTYAAEALAAAAATNSSTGVLLHDVEVLLAPVVNPDGYVHARRGTRLWRKNRARRPGSACVGVDLNRNWGTDFAGPYTTSDKPCSDVYAGPHAFSEPETKAFKSVVEDTEGIVLHLDVHSFGQLVLGPWSHKADAPPGADRVDALGRQIAERLRAPFGSLFVYSRGYSSRLYPASGVMTDWTFSKGIVSYTVELRPVLEPLSADGFLLPVDQIEESCREFFGALDVMLQFANGSDAVPAEPTGGAPDVAGRGFPVAAVVGGLLGALVALLLVGIVAAWLVSRRSSRVRERVPSISSE